MAYFLNIDEKKECNDKHYFNKHLGMNVVKVYSGDCCVTNSENELMVTILGSCISACIRDVEKEIGGMNHFLLPYSEAMDNSSMRYGAYAMESLINAITNLGGEKKNLEIKLFGGANVIANSKEIGKRNCEFVESYLEKEGLPCDSKHVGGSAARRIHYYPTTGKVMMKIVEDNHDYLELEQQEKNYKMKLDKKNKNHKIDGSVELF